MKSERVRNMQCKDWREKELKKFMKEQFGSYTFKYKLENINIYATNRICRNNSVSKGRRIISQTMHPVFPK